MIFLVMGVTGTGKTTIGKLLAERLAVRFADADDFHSEANKQKMSAGTPLTDEDRTPWLQCLHELLRSWDDGDVTGVLACSALKQQYRRLLIDGLTSGRVRLVQLDVPRPLLEARLAQRREHYMNPQLLDSQLATQEQASTAVARISNEGSPEETVAVILRRFGLVAGPVGDAEREA